MVLVILYYLLRSASEKAMKMSLYFRMLKSCFLIFISYSYYYLDWNS